jgi:hypothetical protein
LGNRHKPHRTEAQLRKKKRKKNHHQRQTTTLHRQASDVKDVRAKTPSSLLAPLLPTMIHTELACCQAGLAAVGRCEPLQQLDPLAPPVKTMYHTALATTKQG